MCLMYYFDLMISKEFDTEACTECKDNCQLTESLPGDAQESPE